MMVSLRAISYVDLISSIKDFSDIDTLIERVFDLFLKTVVMAHDFLVVPVHRYTKPSNRFEYLARDLFNTCTPQRVKTWQFTAEDLTDIFQLQMEFFEDVVKNFIEKIEGENSKKYQQKVWKTVKPEEFVDTYLLANPNNFVIFRDIILRSYW